MSIHNKTKLGLGASAAVILVASYVAIQSEQASSDLDQRAAAVAQISALPPTASGIAPAISLNTAPAMALVPNDTDNSAVTIVATTPVTLATHFSPNLEGTDIDGQIKLGEDGRIIVDLAVKDFIDYFLSASDDVGSDVAIDEMLRVVESTLGETGKQQVLALLESYLNYREQAMNLMAQPMLPRDQQTREYQVQMMETTLAELRLLRRATMSPEAVDAFFGLEEAYEDYSISALRIQMNENLSEEQKGEMIAYHRSQLPQVIRQTEERMVVDQQRHASAYASISEAKTESELRESLAQLDYSEAQKQEIVDYYASQKEFDSRYQQYKTEREERYQAASDVSEHDAIRNNLLNKYFTGESELAQARVRDLQG